MEENATEDAFSAIQPEEVKKKRGRKPKEESESEETRKGLKLSFEEAELPEAVTDFIATLKTRGIKDYNLGDIFSEALKEVKDSFWDKKLEELTPLQWKLNAALTNPELKDKLLALLGSSK